MLCGKVPARAREIETLEPEESLPKTAVEVQITQGLVVLVTAGLIPVVCGTIMMSRTAGLLCARV